MDVFDGIRAGVRGDRAQFFKDLSGPFYGANRAGSKASQGMRDTFWLIGMQGSLKAELDCIEQFSETDFTEANRIGCGLLAAGNPGRQQLGSRRGAVRSALT